MEDDAVDAAESKLSVLSVLEDLDSTTVTTEESAKNLIEDELIYHQTDEEENSFFKSLCEGFHGLRESRENKKKPLFALGDPTEEKTEAERSLKQLNSVATVNFIDPTTKSDNAMAAESAVAPKAGNLMSKMQQPQNSSGKMVLENAYEKLSYIFERDYGSTIRSVQYKSMRSGETDIISSLQVNPVLTRTGSGSANGDANVPWGGTAGTAAAPVSDPSEWHNSPFCHVYIAAIESQEHYRTKVRPSLKAFVSQIESAATTPGSQQSAHYLIVYIPTGPKDAKPEESSESTGRVGKFFGHRMQKARERLANYQASTASELDDSVHSKDSVLSEDGLDGDEDDPDSGRSISLNLLTRVEKNIYKKISSEFSNGKVTVLSLSSLERKDDDTIATDGIATRTQEWNSFNRMLGTVIVNGFKDRCRRYTEELKRLDTQRAAAATAAKSGKAKGKNASGSFNLSYFFLVKESLAFTYEQMHLPGEALLQYDEFRAFLPDLTEREVRKAKKHRRKSKTMTDGEMGVKETLIELADAGDFINFRRRIRSEFDLNPIVDTMRRYIFAREISLLFKMEQPVELVTRCQAFSKLMYATMLRGLSELTPEEQRKRKVEAAKWIVQFSWDVKCASEQYLLSMHEITQNMDALSVDTPRSDLMSNASENTQSEQQVASCLSQLLETSRLMMKELGDTELEGFNPLREYEQKLPKDMLQPWGPWAGSQDRSISLNDSMKMTGSNYYTTKGGEGKKAIPREFLLKDAFSSAQAYEDKYLELAAGIVTLSRYANRRRLAGRLQAEIAEYYIRKGELRAAAAIYKAIVKICRLDQWDRCHFWRLFRLAYCQRSTAIPTDYLKTLVTCFSPRIAAVAPTKALHALQTDLEVLIGHPLVGDARYGRLAFIESEMNILETSSDETTMGSGVDRKQLLKRYCNVGENVKIMVSITSHLPRTIELSSVKLFIVAFDTFQSIIEDRESVEEEDAFRILPLEVPIVLEPGKNNFTYNWRPASAGQYILSTLELVWKEGFFYYDSMELPAPLLGVDVLPSEPTHSLSLDPGYLVPGHDQLVRVTFDAGSDVITSGALKLSCSKGLTMIAPGEDPAEGNWKDDCEIDIEACSPGDKKVFETHVRCGLLDKFTDESISRVDSFDVAHGLTANISTKYLHPETDGHEDSSIPKMKNKLEAFAPILEKTALSVESVDVIWTVVGCRAMLSISLMSNTPHHFSIESWNLVLPPPLKVAEGGDLNKDLLKCTVSDGDLLAFAFDCEVSDNDSENQSSDEPLLQVKLFDDVGKSFSLDLALDLNAFFLILWNNDLPKAKDDVTVVLTIDSTEGNVGEPISMRFTVDSSAISDKTTEGKVRYSIQWEQSDWLIGGKTNGCMTKNGAELSCEVIGIPISPGVLDRFPKLGLEYQGETGATKPLHAMFQNPEAFRSMAKTGESAVAFLSSK